MAFLTPINFEFNCIPVIFILLNCEIMHAQCDLILLFYLKW